MGKQKEKSKAAPKTAKPKRPKNTQPTPAGTKVSGALQIKSKKYESQLNAGLNAIDSVHGDGQLVPIGLEVKTLKTKNGFFEMIGKKPTRIVVSTDVLDRNSTLFHEVGHYMDYGWLGISKGATGKEWEKEAGEFWKAVEESEGFKRLQEFRYGKRKIKWKVKKNGVDTIVEESARSNSKYLSYLAQKDELWARAYSQYIATKSNNTKAREFQKQYSPSAEIGIAQQWDDGDFANIASAIDKIMQKAGGIQ